MFCEKISRLCRRLAVMSVNVIKQYVLLLLKHKSLNKARRHRVVQLQVLNITIWSIVYCTNSQMIKSLHLIMQFLNFSFISQYERVAHLTSRCTVCTVQTEQLDMNSASTSTILKPLCDVVWYFYLKQSLQCGKLIDFRSNYLWIDTKIGTCKCKYLCNRVVTINILNDIYTIFYLCPTQKMESKQQGYVKKKDKTNGNYLSILKKRREKLIFSKDEWTSSHTFFDLG